MYALYLKLRGGEDSLEVCRAAWPAPISVRRELRLGSEGGWSGLSVFVRVSKGLVLETGQMNLALMNSMFLRHHGDAGLDLQPLRTGTHVLCMHQQ